MLLNDKNPWRENLKERYLELGNAFVNTQEAKTPVPKAPKDDFITGKHGGGAEGNRTPDLLNAIEALSLLSYSPEVSQYTEAIVQEQ